MNCPNCGRDFQEAEARRGCAGCPMHRSCGRLKCPHCGQEIMQVPRWLRWLAGGKRSGESSETACRSLANMRPGERGVVIGMPGADGRTTRKLMAMGLIPGTELTLVRAKPGVVLQIGLGELALDRETAGHVIVDQRAGEQNVE